MKVIIERWHVSCARARQTIRSFFCEPGTPHGGPSESSLYWVLPGGWRCQLATGGGGSTRGRNPHLSRPSRGWLNPAGGTCTLFVSLTVDPRKDGNRP
jgi:hypothetical protein